MFPIIDFRNGRYQGQMQNQLPHGVGLFIDRNFMFCLAEWIGGEIRGHVLIIFPSGRIFCGKISYRKPQELANLQENEDHVQLITFFSPRSQSKTQKIAAILPLLNTIIQIDNSNPDMARVLQEHQYSIRKEQDNLSTIAGILNLDKISNKELNSYKNCIQFFQDIFLRNYGEILEFFVTDRGRMEYFIGLKGEGLGVKIEPTESELTLLKKKSTKKVYIIRAMGVFTRQNQLKEFGFKTIDNSIKGVLFEQGIYSNANGLIRYEPGKRPKECCVIMHSYLKRSLFYRDKILNTLFIYELEYFVEGFNVNLRKVQTQKIAQFTIQNPNINEQILKEIQIKRREKDHEKQLYFKTKESISELPNPYNPNLVKITNPQYNLHRAKEEIYRSKEKKKGLSRKQLDNYRDASFVDPKDQYRDHDLQQLQKRHTLYQSDDPSINLLANLSSHNKASPADRSNSYKYSKGIEQQPAYRDNPNRPLSPTIDHYKKSPYRYLQTYKRSYSPLPSQQPYVNSNYRSPQHQPYQNSSNYRSPKEQPYINSNYRSPPTQEAYVNGNNYRPIVNTRYNQQAKNNNHSNASPLKMNKYNSPIHQFQFQSSGQINKNPYINRKQDSLAHQPKPLTEHYDSPPFIITPKQTFSPSKEPSRHNSYIEPFNSNSKPMNYRPNHHYDYHFKEENHGEAQRPTYSPSKPYRNDQY